MNPPKCFSFSFLRILFIYFLEREEGRKRERNINLLLPLVSPLLGTWPATQACTLTGNGTGDPLVCRPALNALSYTSPKCFSSQPPLFLRVPMGLKFFMLCCKCRQFHLEKIRRYTSYGLLMPAPQKNL